MNCREWEEAIALYAGGDLDPVRSREVERHLAGCAGCQIFASGMIECLETMRAGHGEEIAPAHFQAVRARVLAKLQPLPWWRSGWFRAAAAAALACCALWLATLYREIMRPAPPRIALARPAAPAVIRLPEKPIPVIPAHAAAPLHSAHPPRRRHLVAPEPLTVRIVTDDPDVVIYWITNPRGE